MAATEGWLIKRGEGPLWGALTEKRRYFALDTARALILYYADESKQRQLGVIDLQTAHKLERLSPTEFDIECSHRVYELRAHEEADATRWVTAVSEALASRLTPPHGLTPQASDADSESSFRVATAPWCIEAVWVDGEHTDAPLQIAAPLPPLDDDADIHVKLADGTTYSVRASTLTDGKCREIASAGDGALLAQLTKADAHLADAAAAAAVASAVAAAASPCSQCDATEAALAAAVRTPGPSAEGSVAAPLSATAAGIGGFVVGVSVGAGACAWIFGLATLGAFLLTLAAVVAATIVAPPARLLSASHAPAADADADAAAGKGTPSEPAAKTLTPSKQTTSSESVGSVLTLHAVTRPPPPPPERASLSERSLCAAERSMLLSHPNRKAAMAPVMLPPLLEASHREQPEPAAAEVPAGAVNFSGKWQLNLERSDDQSELLKAIGVPWVARVAMSNASRTVLIEHDGLEWTETIITTLMSKRHTMLLNGEPHQETSPVDKSPLMISTRFEKGGSAVCSLTRYADGRRTQLVERTLIDEGRTYLVANTLHIDGSEDIHTNSYFEKVG